MVSESSSTFIWLFLISNIVIQFEFKSDFDLTLWYRIVNHEMSFSIDSKYCYSFNAFEWQKKIQFECISESTSINKSDIKWKQNWKTEDLSNSQRPFAFFTVNKKSIHNNEWVNFGLSALKLSPQFLSTSQTSIEKKKNTQPAKMVQLSYLLYEIKRATFTILQHVEINSTAQKLRWCLQNGIKETWKNFFSLQ